MFEIFITVCLARPVDLECATFRLDQLAPSSEQCFMVIDERLESDHQLIEDTIGEFFVVAKSCVPVQGA